MKGSERVIAFVLAAAIGLAAATIADIAIFGEYVGTSNVPPVAREWSTARLLTWPEGVTVAYAGMFTAEDGSPRLKMLLHNGTSGTIRYAAHFPEGPFPSFKINGAEMERMFGCGTGIKDYQIAPGNTAELHVTPFSLPRVLEATDRVAVGFYVDDGSSEKEKQIFSDPFNLPQEVIEAKQAFERQKHFTN